MLAFLQGITDILCKACHDLKWEEPTKIQQEAIPLTLEGNFNNNKAVLWETVKLIFVW